MNVDRQVTTVSQPVRDEREDTPCLKRRRPFQFSLRLLLLIMVPVAILSLTYRWLQDNGYAHKVWHAGVLGAFWGIFILAIWRGLSFFVRDPKEQNEPLLQDLRTIFLAAFFGGLGCACFLAFLLWAAKTFA